MNGKRLREIICHGWLAVFPHWAIAIAITAGLVLAALHLAINDLGLVAGLCAPAIVWATGHTIQWAIRTRQMTARESWMFRAPLGQRRTSGASLQKSLPHRPVSAEVTDYGWFVAFTNRLIHGGATRALPEWASRKDAQAWLAVLVEFGIVERVPDGSSYRAELNVCSVEELGARITRLDFERTIAHYLSGEQR